MRVSWRLEARRDPAVRRVVVPVPHGVLVQPDSGFAFPHIVVESSSEAIVEEPFDLLLVTVGRRVEVNGVVT